MSDIATLPDLLERCREICAQHGNRPDALIEILHAVQAERGYLADDALKGIAHALNISRAEIYGVVTFYHDFRREPPPRHVVKLCRAEACQAVGSEELARHVEARLTDSPSIAVEAVYCLGNCALGPAALVDGKLKARLTPASLDAIFADLEPQA
ncbi:MAG TPA: NAD(P)H-dependent oxidoreductase subunit E [Sphingorhabdus sp.]|jgi:formate dehydrogenase subunit gamma|uniref:NADH-quinone oxidoreductase subunit NuoE family protein n=1 Tax=Sphingorhabdus sp. TaxID=1902408 RepID=UPI002BE0B926|nr:NAD(P)H-dependent oxidoreductase subunit E [Sphingorhabdus sp.]HMT41032.1 NAD(P)H-dependent oxidoreductase subunit E [Sphingorhabdus sp.]HMU22462.1 NAD(P)H-dependent oxidoreductase subunit E [Sphingorhabdus sp.]